MKSPSPRLLWPTIFVLLTVAVKLVFGGTTSIPSASTQRQATPTTNITTTPTTPTTPTLESQAVLKIGVLIPNPNDNEINNSQILSNFNIAALEMAKNDINSQQLIPGIYINLTYAYTSLSDVNTANEIFNTSLLIQENVIAVIGDISSRLTELSAIVTGKFGIPQCSFSSYSASLSDKVTYPTLFRTAPTTYNTVTAVGNYMSKMGWTSISILSTGDLYGSTISFNMYNYAMANNLTILTQNVIQNNMQDDPTAVLSDLFQPWPRIICFFTLNLPKLIDVLVKVNGEGFGLMERNHVWITYVDNNGDLLNACAENRDCDSSYLNGVVIVKDLYNLTGVVPEYDEFLTAWQKIPNMNYMGQQPDDLTWFQPNAYSCVQVLARGFNQYFDEFPGGRINAIQALQNNTFSPANMTPTTFNTGYQGPIGLVNFTETGDLSTGASILYFIYANKTIPFATSIDMKYRNLSTQQIFYDGTTNTPSDKPFYPVRNIYANSISGIVIIVTSSLGLLLCIGTLIIILIYRRHKVIKLGSVLISSLELLGLSISHISVFLYINQPNTAICIIRPAIVSIAAVLVIGGIILRNYRIYRIFNNVFAVRLDIRDPMLAKFLGVLVFIDITLVVLWVVTTMPVPVTVDLMLPDASVFISCTSPHSGVATMFEALVFIYISGLVVYAMYMAFKTRNVSSTWSEAKPIAYVSYNLFIVVLLSVPTMILPSNQIIIVTYLRVITLEFGSISTLLILFGPKLNALFRPGATTQNLYKTSVTRTCAEHTYGTGLRIGDFNYQKGAADYLLSAHEGILPVKIERKRMRLFGGWRMRQVIVFPEISHFLLINKDTMASQSIHYLSASAVETHHPDEHIIKILVGSDLEYFIQLEDELSLENWLTILNRRNTNQPEIRCRTLKDDNHNDDDNNSNNKLSDTIRSHTYNNYGDDDYLSTPIHNNEDISLTPTIPTDIIRSISANPSPSSSLHSQSRFSKRGVVFPEISSSSTARTKTFGQL